MPAGGMADGAPVAPSANEPVTPPQQPQAFMPPMGMGQVDPNQATTKPRQMPGDGDGGGGFPGDEEDEDVEGEAPEEEPDSGGGPKPPPGVQAKRQHAAAVLGMMRTARKENPGLDQRQAYDLAKAALNAYPITKQAEGWDGINFGKRDSAPDGPMARALQNLNLDDISGLAGGARRLLKGKGRPGTPPATPPSSYKVAPPAPAPAAPASAPTSYKVAPPHTPIPTSYKVAPVGSPTPPPGKRPAPVPAAGPPSSPVDKAFAGAGDLFSSVVDKNKARKAEDAKAHATGPEAVRDLALKRQEEMRARHKGTPPVVDPGARLDPPHRKPEGQPDGWQETKWRKHKTYQHGDQYLQFEEFLKTQRLDA
jgi:hypothetical protein